MLEMKRWKFILICILITTNIKKRADIRFSSSKGLFLDGGLLILNEVSKEKDETENRSRLKWRKHDERKIERRFRGDQDKGRTKLKYLFRNVEEENSREGCFYEEKEIAMYILARSF